MPEPKLPTVANIAVATRESWPLDNLIRCYQQILSTVPAKSIYDIEDSPEVGGCGNSYQVLQHVKWMLGHMLLMKDPRKYERWLGFIQGIFYSQKMYTLDDLRGHVRSGEAPL
jgi:hypothetical protein